MAGQAWPAGHELRLRIGLHTGTATRAGGGADYGGFEVNRAARIAASGWGGQIVLSDPTRALIEGRLETEWQIRDLGRHRLKGVPEPEPETE
jgi:class 3 adenylate cyclase